MELIWILSLNQTTQMAQELLDLSRIAPVSPKQLLFTAMDRMKMQTERAGLKLSVVCNENLPDIRADKSRLEQVLVNLIHNAVKFTKPGGGITRRQYLGKERRRLGERVLF